MKNLALIESNTGYVWGLTKAEDAKAAVLEDIAGDAGWELEEVGLGEQEHYNYAGYWVHEVPMDFDSESMGDDKDFIAAVEAHPPVAFFTATSAEDRERQREKDERYA